MAGGTAGKRTYLAKLEDVYVQHRRDIIYMCGLNVDGRGQLDGFGGQSLDG